MPFYKYYCRNCDTRFTISHSMTEKKITCEVCKKDSLEKDYNNNFLVVSDIKQSGKVVDEYIKNAKEDLKEQLEENRKKEYK